MPTVRNEHVALVHVDSHRGCSRHRRSRMPCSPTDGPALDTRKRPGSISRCVPLLGLALAVTLAATPVAQATRPGKQYYLSLGDSYAVGFQLNGATNRGFADQLVPLLVKRGYDVRLVNLGCAGATTRSMVRQVNCPAVIRAPGAPAYRDQ